MAADRDGQTPKASVPEDGLEAEVKRLRAVNAALVAENASLRAALANPLNALKNGRLGGRPKRAPEPGERVPLSLRVTPHLKTRLDQAAEAAGRSISQEAEMRIESSFQRESLVVEALSMALGRREVAALVLMIGLVMVRTQRMAAPRLLEAFIEQPDAVDLYLMQTAIDASHAVLEAARPEGLTWNILKLEGAVETTNAVIGALRVGEYPAVSTYPITLKHKDKPDWLTGDAEALMQRVAKERMRMLKPVELWGQYYQLAERMGAAPPLPSADQSRAAPNQGGQQKTGT